MQIVIPRVRIENGKIILFVCLLFILGAFFNVYSEELLIAEVRENETSTTTLPAAEISAASTSLAEEVGNIIESLAADIKEAVVGSEATTTQGVSIEIATSTVILDPATATSTIDTATAATTTVITDSVVDTGAITIDSMNATTTLTVNQEIATSTEIIDFTTATSTVATSTIATSTASVDDVAEKSEEEKAVEEEQKEEEAVVTEDPIQIRRESIIALITKNSGGDDSWLARPGSEALINKLSQLTENNFITPDLPLAFKENKIFWVDGSGQMIYGWDIDRDNLFGTPIGNQEEWVLEFEGAGEGWRLLFEPMEKILTLVSTLGP